MLELELELVEQILHKSQATPKQLHKQISSKSQAYVQLLLELEMLELERVEQLLHKNRKANLQHIPKQFSSKSKPHL